MLKLYVSLHNFFHQPLLRRDERGVTSVEYGLLVALIALVIIGVVTTLGLNGTFKGIFGNAGGPDDRCAPSSAEARRSPRTRR